MNEMKVDDRIQALFYEFSIALENEDFFECAKKIGALEYLGFPDTDNLSGMAFQMSGDYRKALEYLSKVKSNSPFYSESLHGMMVNYMMLGEYILLDKMLRESFKCSPLEELEYRIKCLEHANFQYIIDHEEEILKMTSREVEAKNYTGQEALVLWEICRMLSDALVITGECINQCAIYQSSIEKPLEEFHVNEDVKRITEEYKKWCIILDYSKYICSIRLPVGITSLSICALSDKAWGEKLRIFRKTNYVEQIMNIILGLCSNTLHGNIDSYLLVEQILSLFIRIDPCSISKAIDYFYDIIAYAYKNGSATAAQYLGYAYAEIIATGKDLFSLKDRIDAVRNEDTFAYEQTAKEIKLTRTMSRKGHDALLNAERAFSKTKDEVAGARDYSALSLQFFRVIEIEYSEKLVIPLAQKMDYSIFGDLIDECEDEDIKKKFKVDLGYLKKISSGSQTSIEVGAVRTLLAHTVGRYYENEECAKYLLERVCEFLTDEGREALRNKTMLNIIQNTTLEEYRNPGAHTGFLPYSVACECREYVLAKLPLIVTWFK